MRLSYFDDTDTLYIELKSSEVIESKELDENTILDYDEAGKRVSISVEPASERADLEHLSLSGIAA